MGRGRQRAYGIFFYWQFSFWIHRRQTIRRHMRQRCCWVVRRAIVAPNVPMDILRAHLVHIRIRIKRSTVNRKDNTVSHNIHQVRICDTTCPINRFNLMHFDLCLQPIGVNFCHHRQSIRHHCHWAIVVVHRHWDYAMCQTVLARFDVQPPSSGQAPVYPIIKSKFERNEKVLWNECNEFILWNFPPKFNCISILWTK